MSNFKKGFTLIELIVVISIIGFLTTLAFASFSQARQQSRDQKRISDLSGIQLALEQYFNKFGFYPSTIDELYSGQYKFLGQIPTPPSTYSIYNYVTLSNQSNPAVCTSYQLWTRLEGANSTASSSKKGFDSLPDHLPTQNGVDLCAGNSGAQIDASSDPLIYDVMPQI